MHHKQQRPGAGTILLRLVDVHLKLQGTHFGQLRDELCRGAFDTHGGAAPVAFGGGIHYIPLNGSSVCGGRVSEYKTY